MAEWPCRTSTLVRTSFLPPSRPLALAAARLAAVCSLMNSLSNSAKIPEDRLPAAAVVSMAAHWPAFFLEAPAAERHAEALRASEAPVTCRLLQSVNAGTEQERLKKGDEPRDQCDWLTLWFGRVFFPTIPTTWRSPKSTQDSNCQHRASGSASGSTLEQHVQGSLDESRDRS